MLPQCLSWLPQSDVSIIICIRIESLTVKASIQAEPEFCQGRCCSDILIYHCHCNVSAWVIGSDWSVVFLQGVIGSSKHPKREVWKYYEYNTLLEIILKLNRGTDRRYHKYILLTENWTNMTQFLLIWAKWTLTYVYITLTSKGYCQVPGVKHMHSMCSSER